jgi:hypothetical protein
MDCSSEGVVYAFLDRVFSRFEAPTKVLTDQDTKFHGEFQEFCEKALIDHRTTSQDHLEVDRLCHGLGYFGTSSVVKYHGLGYFWISMVRIFWENVMA